MGYGNEYPKETRFPDEVLAELKAASEPPRLPPCQRCDGTGICQHCEGRGDAVGGHDCDHCFQGGCYKCDGTGIADAM